MDPIRLLVVDDHKVVREGIIRLLGLEDSIEVVGEAASGESAISLLKETEADVLLIDLNMPGIGGIETIRRLKRECGEELQFVALTFHDDEKTVYEALKAGALGYVLKDAGADQIFDSIKKAYHGEYSIEPDLLKRIIGKILDSERVSDDQCETDMGGAERIDLLTVREREVLVLVGRGCSNRKIAEELYISEKTVKNHITSILKKLELDGRTSAAVFAVKNGMI